jgi:hypothetical protein
MYDEERKRDYNDTMRKRREVTGPGIKLEHNLA